MKSLLGGESLGGNAGRDHLAANFYYNKETGEIIYFGNIQDVPEKILDNEQYVEGTFMYYLSFVRKGKVTYVEEKIDGIIFDKHDTLEARKVLALSAELYNKIHGGVKTYS